MAYQLTDPDDIKVFILYILKNVGGTLSYNDLHDAVVIDNMVSPFDAVHSLTELADKKNIEIRPDKKSPKIFVSITEQGTQVAETLQSRFNDYVRTKSLESALRYLDFKKRGITAHCSVKQAEGDSYDFKVKLTEKDSTLLELTVKADNVYLAEKMRYNFESHPETVYRSIISLLSGDAGFLLT